MRRAINRSDARAAQRPDEPAGTQAAGLVHLLGRVTDCASACFATPDDLRGVLAHILDATHFTVGHARHFESTDMYAARDLWEAADGETVPHTLQTATAQTDFGVGVGLPGHCWGTAEPAWVAEIASATNFPRRDAALAAGLNSAMAFPVLVGNRAVAVLEFFAPDARAADPLLLDVARILGHAIGRGFERHQAQNERVSDRALAQLILENAKDAFVSIDDEGLVTGWNSEAEDMFGWPASEALGSVMSELIIPPEYRHDHTAGVHRYIKNGHGRVAGKYVELEALRRSGEKFPIEMAFWGMFRDGHWNFYSFARDITQRKAHEADLLYRTVHDELTGLPNRTAAIEYITHALAERDHAPTAASAATHDPTPGEIALLFLDLDRFKVTKERLGHGAADDLLRAVAGRITEAVREADWVARVADDEFVVVCHDVREATTAQGIAERIQGALKAPVDLAEDQVAVGTSIGIVLPRADGDTAEDMLSDLSAGISVSREQTRGAVKVFDEQARNVIRRRLSIERDLAAAIERGQLRVFYQPVIDLRGERVVGVEALVRWQHPERGLLGPGEFIALAEESGLIVPLGDWVLRESCRQAAEWQRLGGRDLTVAVNLSARQFTQSGLAQRITDVVGDAGVDSEHVQLALEVTETLLMHDPDATARTLTELHESGLRLSIDDFGTGYSSLAYLKAFPVDVVKIDRAFVMNLETDPDDRAIVAAVTQLGHALGLTVLAEGIETEGQRAIVTDMGCDEAQGFYFGRPMPAAQVTPLLLGAAPAAQLA